MLRRLLLACSILLSVGVNPGLALEGHRYASQPPVAPPGSDFDAMMARSMERMHADRAIAPSRDPDRDFAVMMIPHHQGAIDMAKAQLLYGRDPTLRRLAQGIIVEQMQEIDVMRRALAGIVVPEAPHPGAESVRPGHDHSSKGSRP
jgi:hypothetical protein